MEKNERNVRIKWENAPVARIERVPNQMVQLSVQWKVLDQMTLD